MWTTLTSSRWGLVYVPTLKPAAASMREIICTVEPLPFVPVTWMTGALRWGSPSAAQIAAIGSVVGESIRPVFWYDM